MATVKLLFKVNKVDMIKINIASNGAQHMLPKLLHGKNSVLLVSHCCPNDITWSYMRKLQTKLNWEKAHKITYTLQNVTVMKSKGNLKNCSRLKDTKEIRQLDITHHLGFSFTIKDSIETVAKNLNKVQD